MVQSNTQSADQFHGSNKTYYSGLSLSSGAAWTNVSFSGTNWGFGPHSQEEGNRFLIAGSPGNTASIQWSWNSGTTVHGTVWSSEQIAMDGVKRQGVAIRTNTNSQQIRIWVW